MKNYILIGFFLLFWHQNLSSQGYGQSYVENLKVQIPASPNAASLGEFGNYEVSYYTGALSTSIPIYSINGRSISHSISLSYNGSGNKVETIPSWVGLGWTLNAGGVITRTVQGNPDEGRNYYDVGPIVNYTANFDNECIDAYWQYDSIQLGLKETQPDLYRLSAGNISSTFIITQNKEILKKTRDGLDIQPFFNNEGDIDYFLVRDPSGVEYVFSETELSYYVIDDGDGTIRFYYDYEFNSSWYLREIRSPNTSEKIIFSYESVEDWSDLPYNVDKYKAYVESVEVYLNDPCQIIDPGDPAGGPINTGNDPCGETLPSYPFVGITLYKTLHRQFLTGITYHLGNETLESISFDSENHNYHNLTNDRKLNLININGLIDWHFSYDDETNRLTLQSVQEKASIGTEEKEPYQFNYVAQKLPQTFTSNYIDHWGYYNGPNTNNNSTLIPTINGIGLDAHREPDESYMIAGMLSEIIYPTKGKTRYEFGSHLVKTNDPPFQKAVGGIRLNKVTNYDSDGTELNTRIFNYTDSNGYSSGILFTEPRYESFSTYTSFPYGQFDPTTACNRDYQCDRTTISATSNEPLKTVKGSFVGYSSVEVVFPGNGKSIYHYRDTETEVPGFFESPTLGNLLVLEHYKEEENGISNIVQRINHTYSSDVLPSLTQVEESMLFWYPYPEHDQDNKVHLCQEEEWCQFYVNNYECGSASQHFPKDVTTKYEMHSKDASQYWHFLVSTSTENHYYDTQGIFTGILTTEVKYEYENDNITSPTQTYSRNSDNKEYKIKYYFAHDLGEPELEDEHMIGIPLKEEKYVDNELVLGVWLEYENLRPKKLSSYAGGSWYQEIILSTYDNNGYPTEIQKDGWNPELYFWEKGLLKEKHFNEWISIWEWDYDSRQLESFTDVDGQVFTYDYDGLLRLEAATSNGGNQRVEHDYSYINGANLTNEMKSTISFSDGTPDRKSVQYFDGMGRGMQTLGVEYGPNKEDVILSQSAYDSRDRNTIEDYMPNTFIRLEYEKSPLDRLVKRENPDENFELFEYGTNIGNEVENNNEETLFKQIVYDENNSPTTIYTDKIGQNILVVDAESNKTWSSYDKFGNLISVNSPAGSFVYSYDEHHRIETISIPGAGTTTITYYDNDLIESITDANGNQNINYYDDYGQLLEVYTNGILAKRNTYDFNHIKTELNTTLGDAQGSTSLPNTFIEYFYDGLWRVNYQNISTAVGSDVIDFSYNAADAITRSIRTHTGAHPIVITDDFEYDHMGRMKRNWQKLNQEPRILMAAQEYSVRDELLLKKLHSINGGNSFLQKVNYGYNVMGWLTNINEVETPIIEDDFESCTLPWGAYDEDIELTLDLEDLLDLLAEGGEPIICDIEPCENNQLELCDYVINFPNDRQVIHSINEIGHVPIITFNPPLEVFATGFELTLENEIITFFNDNNYQFTSVDVIPNYEVDEEGDVNLVSFDVQIIQSEFPFYSLSFWEGNSLFAQQNCIIGGGSNNCYQVPAPPNCSNSDIEAQNTSVSIILDSIGNINTSIITFPFQLELVQLCDGSTFWLPAEMLPLLEGYYNVLTNRIFNNLEEVCSVTLKPEFDLFKEKLTYYDDAADLQAFGQKNGNIATMKWQVGNRVVQAYGFQYDQINRLKNAYYKDYYYELVTVGGGNNAPGVGYVLKSLFPDAYTTSNITYDGAGNLQSLDRNGWVDCQIQSIDQLTYHYQTPSSGGNPNPTSLPPNQLGYVQDASGMIQGVPQPQIIYSYDAIGSMTQNGDKFIEYNFLNLPKQIKKDDFNYIDFWYDADGNKLKKIVIENGITSYVKDYVNGIEYKDGLLEAIYTTEGRIVYSDEVDPGETPYIYEYSLNDHLGNSRVVFSDLDNNRKITIEDDLETNEEETLEVLQENHYYPFGLNMAGPWIPNTGIKNKYQFNGKVLTKNSNGSAGAIPEKPMNLGMEHLDDFDLDINMAFYRSYDPSIGRWWQVDPKSETFYSMSPYNSNLNNPILNSDPNGDICVPCIVIGIGVAFEYGTQVYGNYSSDDSIYDNFVGKVDFADVAIEAASYISGSRVYATALVEGAKASVDYTGNGELSYILDGTEDKTIENILKETAKNTLISEIGGVINAKSAENFSDKAVKSAKSDIVSAQKNLDKAKRIAGDNYPSSPGVYIRDQQLAGAKDTYTVKYFGNEFGLGTKGGAKVAEELSQTEINNIVNFIDKITKEDEEKK